MNLEIVLEGLMLNKVSISLVQGDIIRISILRHLGQAEVAVKG